MVRRQIGRWVGVLGLTMALGCRPSTLDLEATSPAPEEEGSAITLLVGAAASLQGAMDDIQPRFEAAHPGIDLDYTFAASGQLQQQIEQGAPIDVFMSASPAQMEALADGGYLLPNSRRDLLSNTLVLIVPKGSTLGLTDFTDLTQPEVQQIAVGDFGSVPAGQYAEQVLSNLGLLTDIRPKLIFVNTVREVLATVASNNVAAGFVYATDAATSDQITVVATADADLHSPIVYPVAVINETAQADAALTFVDYLSSEAARAIFLDHGFIPLD